MIIHIRHITPVDKYPNTVIPAQAGHAVKLLRYPEKHWMPDQIRHDGVGYLVTRLIITDNFSDPDR
jgi:hypothetical protein